jgi:hypothetical protein
LKAKSLYNVAQQILGRIGISHVQASGCDVFDILSLTIWNNLAQIDYFLSEFDASQQQFMHLAAYAGTVALSSYNNPASTSALSVHMACILDHMILLLPPVIAAAA